MSGIKQVWQKAYRLYAVRKNVSLGEKAHIGIGSILWAPSRLIVGNNIYIGKNCTIECDGEIGNNVLIANQAGLIGRWDHDYRAVGYPIRQAPWIGDPDYKGEGKNQKLIVEDDVWIGYGAVVLSGIRIGRGAVIGAGSVVTKDVPAYAIVAGVPARVVSYRFNQSEVNEHETKIYGRALTTLADREVR